MFLDLHLDQDNHGPECMGANAAARPDWTVLIPFFNEAAYLPQTIACVAAQTRRATLVLVDNGSTDGSAAIAEASARRLGLDYRLVVEPRPGKVHALATGLREVDTRLLATWDADTWYPAHYLAAAADLLRRPGTVAAGAGFIRADWRPGQARRSMRKVRCAAMLLSGQCHTGGAGQVFDVATLRRAGGFDPARWNYVLEDHEIVHQMLKHGRLGYAEAFWCAPSVRPRNRRSTRWSLFERLVYHAAVGRSGDWFFTHFLGPRLAQRSLTSDRLRETAHQSGYDHATPHLVCG